MDETAGKKLCEKYGHVIRLPGHQDLVVGIEREITYPAKCRHCGVNAVVSATIRVKVK
jgi:hypothetical protein